MTVAKWMSRELISVDQDDPVSLAFELLLTNNIRHLPVLCKKKLVGIVTDHDLNEALVPSDPSASRRSMYRTIKDIKVKQVMTPNPITILRETPIQEAAKLFLERRIDCLPVKGPRQKLVGILTSTDILKAFLEFTQILRGTERVDVVMEANQYENILQLFAEKGISVISIGITSDNDLDRTVFSFRIKEFDLKKLTKLLQSKGYSVLPDD